MSSLDAQELQTIYARRFRDNQAYRQRVWRVLVRHIFQPQVPRTGAVLDLGCGYGEFINTVQAAVKYGMDLNPASAENLAPGVKMLRQDCSARWELPDDSLDVVFTSNFFEHLPDKATLTRTLQQARRCLKPGGKLIAMGPNIKYLPGDYWDFWDHYLPLTGASLSEGLETNGFQVAVCHPRFLPYTTKAALPSWPMLVKVYLRVPILHRVLGKQMFVVGVRP